MLISHLVWEPSEYHFQSKNCRQKCFTSHILYDVYSHSTLNARAQDPHHIPSNNELPSVSFRIQIFRNRIFYVFILPFVGRMAVWSRFSVVSHKMMKWHIIMQQQQQVKNMLRLKTFVIVKWLKLIASLFFLSIYCCLLITTISEWII